MMAGSLHVEMVSRIAMAGAIVPTYRRNNPEPSPAIIKRLNAIEFYTAGLIRLYGKLGKNNIANVCDKIEVMRQTTCLGKPRSVLTFIDYAIELLEGSMKGQKPLAGIKGRVGVKKVTAMISALMELRNELAMNRNYESCSIAGIKAAETWIGMGDTKHG